MKKATIRLFLIILLINIGLSIAILSSKPSIVTAEPEVQTVFETKYITETEYINSNEPIEMVVTAYTAGKESTGKSPGDKAYGITKTGTKAKVGVCAVDPNYIPLGSSLFVEGYGYCRAEDTGGKVKGYHVDVFIDKLQDALEFGREQRKVWILQGFEENET